MTSNLSNHQSISSFLSKDQPIFTNGIFNSQDKARLEPLSRKPFFELIEKKNEKKVPYILGVTPDCFNSEMDGVSLHKSYKTYGVNPYTGNKMKDIYFYTINKDEDELSYLGKISEQDKDKGTFLDTFIDANEGNPNSQVKLGDLYRKGQGVKKDLNEALKYYQLAGDVSKMGELALELGDYYYDKKDIANVIKYYTMALNSDHKVPDIKLGAISALFGDFYWTGKGVEKNLSTAMDYYQLAVDAGCVNSQVKIAFILETGCEGFEKNPMKSLDYYKRAAAQDHPQAMLKVASYHIMGQNQNIHEATRLINRFADLKLGENLAQLQPWIKVMRESAPRDEKFQMATSRLFMQCAKGQRPKGNSRALNDVTNTAQEVNQGSLYAKRLNRVNSKGRNLHKMI